MKRYWKQIAYIAAFGLVVPCIALAQGPPKPSSMANPLAQILVVIIIALAIIIGLMANVVTGAAQVFIQKIRDTRNSNNTSPKTLSVIALLLFTGSAWAQDAANAATDAAPAVNHFGGLSGTVFYTLISVIAVEIIILMTLIYNLKMLLRKESVANTAVVPEEITENALAKWWDKINKFRPLKEEQDIDLGHDYDGIRELDNGLPPWWLYGFYCCVFFACVYLWRYHVSSDAAPSSAEEYTIAVAKAEVEKEAYLKNAASKVDENSVKLLTEAADLEAGKKIFTSVCAACHLADGGGAVGPNLTDDYWLHGGSIKDVFKTLKYGWPEKGMKSWKDDYSPVQLAQLASYVKSLKGTKPAKPKEPQGELYSETVVAAKDSTKATTVATPTK